MARIDTGIPDGAPDTDIEGNSRLCGTSVDIGAYEYPKDPCLPPPMLFRRGNVNTDDITDLSDAVFLLNYLFTRGLEPSCLKSADTDDNGTLEITDPILLLNFLFLGGRSPEAPFLDCGTDATDDELTCRSFPSCR